MNRLIFPLCFLLAAILACGQSTPTPAAVERGSKIPTGALKQSPADDKWPPIASAGWSQPKPLPGPVNTPGGEDSPFITQDDQSLYFFFTPDVNIPAEKQLLDGVTGIWMAHREEGTWSDPERVRLSTPGKLALDGCEFVSGDRMYFCSAREGYNGIQWFSAEKKDGVWQNWRYAGDELKQSQYEVGELHITADGQELYFHSSRPGGYGSLDIWVSQRTTTGWGEPVNPGPQINSPADEGWPFVSIDGHELWFSAPSQIGKPGPAIYLSTRQADGRWGEAIEILSSFAGEPTLSANGKSLYFVHHFFSADLKQMLEADIYYTTRP